MATVPETEVPVMSVEPRSPWSVLRWPLIATRWFIDEVRWTARVLFSSADRFYWDNGFSKAASLAYTTLFALVPLTVLVFGLLGSFALSQENLPEVKNFIFRQFVPQIDRVNELIVYLTQFTQTLTSSSLNTVAVVFIVVTAILLINSIEFALNEIWQVYEPRTISQRIGIYCAVLVLAPMLALSAYYFAKFRPDGILENIGIEGYATLIYATLIPFLIDFLSFAALYFLVPKAPVRWGSAVFGAFVAALLFGFAKSGFAYYIVAFSSYDKIYGALASIPIFLFWLYLAWTIVLVGAETAYQAQYLPAKGKVWKRTVLSMGDGRMVLAVQALVMIVRAFEKGDPLPNDLEIAVKIGCSSVLLKPALDALERNGILQRGDSRSMPLVLLKSPEKISITEIRLALFGQRDALFYCEELGRMFTAVNSGPRGNITLAELAKIKI